ncbi:hypothetical protein SDC9_98906 [bioreactor metagenome]|uniref:Uncharacterized protein n=1 Tax=bioreactor metagenome TaxID=1076179 RepID=A0A645AG29_9ZZZZ
MQLIDEEDDIAVIIDFINNFFHSFLEFTAVFRTRYKRTHIQHHDALVCQCIRNIAGYDFLCQTFHDGGLADSRFPYQNRIVLRSAGNDLHDTTDFLVASNDRIHPVFTRQVSQITG